MEKPKLLKIVSNMLYLSLLFGVVKIMMVYSGAVVHPQVPQEGMGVFLFSAMAVLAFLFFLFYKVSQGKNWARIVFLVFSLLGFIPAFGILASELKFSAVYGSVSIVQTLLQMLGLVLLFIKPASLYFKKENREG